MSVILRDIDNPQVVGYLGNQLFQLACAYSLAIKNGVELIVPPFEYQDVFENRFFTVINKDEIQIDHEYNEPFFHYQEIPYQPNINLVGYYQSYKYFDEIDIRKLFEFKDEVKERALYSVNKQLNETYENIFAYNRVASIHQRRQDYLSYLDHFTQLHDTDYYTRAIKESDKDVDYFLVFSNDIEFSKSFFTGEKFIFCESEQEVGLGNKSSVNDLYLQSCVDDLIIANSSFSYWSGMLCDSLNKKVIYPKSWFGPALSQNDTKDLCPESWIGI